MTEPDRAVPSLPRRLDHDEIDSQRQGREFAAAGEAVREQPTDGGTKVRALAVVDGLLPQPEGARGTPAHLDDHEDGGRAGVDRDEIELAPPDSHVPAQDRPAVTLQLSRDRRLGCIAVVLGCRPHMGDADDPTSSLAHRRISASGRRADLERSGGVDQLDRLEDLGGVERLEPGEIRGVEHRVVGHDRHRLAVEQLMRVR
jgi:hypothetical protein